VPSTTDHHKSNKSTVTVCKQYSSLPPFTSEKGLGDCLYVGTLQKCGRRPTRRCGRFWGLVIGKKNFEYLFYTAAKRYRQSFEWTILSGVQDISW